MLNGRRFHDAATQASCHELSTSPRWIAAVENDWPAPIAHEYHRLREVLADGQIVSAVLQLKDVAEILVKFPALVMARWLEEHGDDEQKEALNRRLLGKIMSLGDWLSLAGDFLAPALARQAPPGIKAIAAAFRTESGRATPLYRFLAEMIPWRNSEIGHGAFRLDVSEFLDDLKQHIDTLHSILEPITRVWGDTLLVKADGSPMHGWQAIRSWHDGSAGAHAEAIAPLYLQSGPDKLDLAPLIALRHCSVCGKQDVFLFDARDGRRKPGKLYFLDYLAGHKMARPGHVEPRLDLDVEQDAGSHDLDADYLDSQVDELLQSKSLEAEYLPVDYLREPLRAFLESHDAGVWWLQAPAHIGKSLFVHALTPEAGLEDPLLDDLMVVAFHIRREYRYHPAQLKETLAGQLKQRMGLNNLSRELPELDLNAADPAAAFAKWLGAWWAIRPPRWRIPGSRLLVCIDGLDEIALPGSGQRSLADYLPDPQHLPDGVYVLLTSRPEDGCPRWVWQAATQRIQPGQARSQSFAVGLDHPDYLALLRQYFDWQLKTRLKNFDVNHRNALFDTLVERGEGRFLYVSLLCGLLADSALGPDQVASLPSGAGLYGYYLDTLESRLAAKPRSNLQRLLLLLSAAEEAAIADYRLQAEAMQDDDQGGAVPEGSAFAWDGMPLPVLASLMGDPPGQLSSRTVFALYSLKQVLRVERADGAVARYRLGLKELLATVRERWADALNAVHRELAEGFWLEWRDRWDQLESEHSEDLWRLRYLFGHSLALQEHSVNAPWMVDLANDERFIRRLRNENQRRYDEADYAESITWSNRIIWSLQQLARSDAPASPLEDLANEYIDRGVSLFKRGEIAHAIIDFDRAIRLIRAQLKRFDEAGQDNWPLRLFDLLAEALMTRGMSILEQGNIAGAVTDCGLAVDLRLVLRGLVAKRGNGWPLNWENNLAVAHVNHGICLAKQEDRPSAVAEFKRAIEIGNTLQEQKCRTGDDWPTEWQHNLALAYRNRGVALLEQNDAASAVADFKREIELREALREQLTGAGQVLHPEMLKHLAAAYSARGNALLEQSDIAGSIADHNRAISLLTVLGEQLAEAGQPRPLPWYDELAYFYMNRGNALGDQGDAAGAVTDYGHAITLREALRDQLAEAGLALPPASQDRLASCYGNRGVSLAVQGYTADAVADFNRVIELREALRDQLAEAGLPLPPAWQDTLVRVYLNRGKIMADQGNGAAAFEDFASSLLLGNGLIEHGYIDAISPVIEVHQKRLNMAGCSLDAKEGWLNEARGLLNTVQSLGLAERISPEQRAMLEELQRSLSNAGAQIPRVRD
jgi:hypothetical protein